MNFINVDIVFPFPCPGRRRRRRREHAHQITSAIGSFGHSQQE
jgi:hypothetical protein